MDRSIGKINGLSGVDFLTDTADWDLEIRLAMPEPTAKKTRAFKTPRDLHEWLEKDHAAQDELWIKIFKKGSGIASVTWNEVVIETLCWGWIDGGKKSLDDTAYLQRITPRKPRSAWSRKNTEHVDRLGAEGRMQDPGLAQVQAAKDDGRWENAYAPASEMEVPADFLAAVESRVRIKKFYDTLNKTNRYAIAHGRFLGDFLHSNTNFICLGDGHLTLTPKYRAWDQI